MRNLGLDIFRVIALFLVLGNHLVLPQHEGGWMESMLSFWKCGGWVGVDLFFVLSGYLVSSLLFHEHSLQRFYLV